jgi:hypothetical protein
MKSSLRRVRTAWLAAATIMAGGLAALAAPPATAAEASPWWGEVGLGSGHLNMATTATAPSVTDSGLDLGIAAGYALTPNLRVGVGYHTLVTAVGWCFYGCSQDQRMDTFHALARYCPEAGCAGWYLQGGAGISSYQDSHNFAWAGTPEGSAMDRNGRGSSYELGLGYRFHGRRTRGPGLMAVYASYGGGHISPDFSGAYAYNFNMARLTVSLNIP